MSSVTHSQSELPSEHEELVAYLDGELGPEECRRVEERLANDAAYRQQLRELDQAWEVLGALPATTADDAFARTTIELACIAAEQDLSQRTALAAVENRARRRWWVAVAVAAGVMAFVMVRALAMHRTNSLLADLPVIAEVKALGLVPDIDFLRELSRAGFNQAIADVTKDQAFQRELDDFTKANSPALSERREWIDSLSPEKKAELADRARAFEALHQRPEERERMRRLAKSIGEAEDYAALRTTLVGLSQWLSRQAAGDQYDLQAELTGRPSAERVSAVMNMLAREKEQAARTLSPEDKKALREEIFALAREKRDDFVANLPADKAQPIPTIDAKNERIALFFFLRGALQNDEAVMRRLEQKLSPQARDHLDRISRWQPERRRWQMWGWIHDATQPRPKPEELERFFVSDHISADQRQKLLDLPRDKMDVALERLYLKTELGIDEPWPPMREFAERGRGPRDGQRGFGPPDGNRRGPGPQRGPDGPPPDRPFPPPGEYGRDPLGPGAIGPPPPRPEDGPERRRRRPPNGEGPRDGRQEPLLPPPRSPVEVK